MGMIDVDARGLALEDVMEGFKVGVPAMERECQSLKAGLRGRRKHQLWDCLLHKQQDTPTL
jgi:hypothetical protein